jgi:nucleoid DNA-binding protein
MLNDYIKELIASNNRVIIPNFGAFLLRATSKNKNKKELSEKIQDIYFSPFLKFNDELLVNHIIKKENTNQKEAMDKIGDYVKGIENSVKKDGVYKIEGLGEFYQDDQGKIQFKVASDEAKEEEKPKTVSSSAKKTTQAKKSSTVNEKAAGKKKETTSSEKKEEPAKSTPDKTQKAQEKPKEEQKPPRKEPVSKATARKGAQTPPPKKPSSAKTTSGGKKGGGNKGLVLAIVIGVPVAALFVWAMLNFDTVEKIFSGKETKTEQIAEKTKSEKEKKAEEAEKKQEKEKQEEKADKSKKKATQQETTKPKKQKPEKTQVQKANKGTKKFYIVAGSFRNLEYAKKFNQDLIKQGYNSELIGERNGMHAVSYNSYKNKSQAVKELQEMRDKGLQVWLLYY